MLFPFYTRGDLDSERLGDMPEIPQQVRVQAGLSHLGTQTTGKGEDTITNWCQMCSEEENRVLSWDLTGALGVGGTAQGGLGGWHWSLFSLIQDIAAQRSCWSEWPENPPCVSLR